MSRPPEGRPLQGRRVAVTRARAQAADLIQRLEALGAEVVAVPLIRIAGPDELEPAQQQALGAAVQSLDTYQALVLTSTNGVDALFHALRAAGRDARALSGLKVVAVGPATAAALERHGARVDLMPSREFRGTALVPLIVEKLQPGGRALLVRGDLAGDDLPAGLAAAGIEVDDVVSYRTLPDGTGAAAVRTALEDGRMDAITFASPSAVENFVTAVGPDAAALLRGGPERRGAAAVCIGPVTAEKARELGIPVRSVAAESTLDGLVRAVTEALAPTYPKKEE